MCCRPLQAAARRQRHLCQGYKMAGYALHTLSSCVTRVFSSNKGKSIFNPGEIFDEPSRSRPPPLNFAIPLKFPKLLQPLQHGPFFRISDTCSFLRSHQLPLPPTFAASHRPIITILADRPATLSLWYGIMDQGARQSGRPVLQFCLFPLTPPSLVSFNLVRASPGPSPPD